MHLALLLRLASDHHRRIGGPGRCCRHRRRCPRCPCRPSDHARRAYRSNGPAKLPVARCDGPRNRSPARPCRRSSDDSNRRGCTRSATMQNPARLRIPGRCTGSGGCNCDVVQLNARLEAENRLSYMALHDDLTGLPNRRALIEELDRRLSSGRSTTALLFLDLDRFKYMNDYLGHLAGDRVLLTIADRIRMSVRPGDFTARLGGDEFLVVMNGTGGELGSMATANRLLSLVSKPLEVSSQHVSHTASVGIAIAHPGEIERDAAARQRRRRPVRREDPGPQPGGDVRRRAPSRDRRTLRHRDDAARCARPRRLAPLSTSPRST